MADYPEKWTNEDYDTKRGKYDDRGGYARQSDEANGLATARGEKSHHDRAWRFSTLTDFLE